MTTTTQEALQAARQALEEAAEAFDDIEFMRPPGRCENRLIEAIELKAMCAKRKVRAALAAPSQQAAQEPQPVAYEHVGTVRLWNKGGSGEYYGVEWVSQTPPEGKLYAAAPAKPAEQERVKWLLAEADELAAENPSKDVRSFAESVILLLSSQQAPSTAAREREDAIKALLDEIAGFQELNEANYTHEDVAELNNWGVMVWDRAQLLQKDDAALAHKGAQGEKA